MLRMYSYNQLNDTVSFCVVFYYFIDEVFATIYLFHNVDCGFEGVYALQWLCKESSEAHFKDGRYIYI